VTPASPPRMRKDKSDPQERTKPRKAYLVRVPLLDSSGSHDGSDYYSDILRQPARA
jgi:hypothetical protein